MRFRLVSGFVIGAAMIVVSSATRAYAGNFVASPEIDPGTVVAGLGLAAAGALLLRARRRSK